MINPLLHKQPVVLDRAAHGKLLLDAPTEQDLSFSAGLNSIFVAAAEFSDACREFPLVFIPSGAVVDGVTEYAPIAVLGLERNQNLYLHDGRRWRADYVPVLLRTYPFCISRMNDEQFAVCVDMAWPGLNEQKGLPIFTPGGEPTELMANTVKQLELLEAEIQRTRAVCNTLSKLGAMKAMRFEAVTPSGRKHNVDGFFTVDAEVLQNLPDSTVGELHRSGTLGLVQLHWASMSGMRRLVQWQTEQGEAAQAASPVADTVTG